MTTFKEVEHLASTQGWTYPHPVARVLLLAKHGAGPSQNYTRAILASLFSDDEELTDAATAEKRVGSMMACNSLNSAGSTATEIIRGLTRSCIEAGFLDIPMKIVMLNGDSSLMQEVRAEVNRALANIKQQSAPAAQPGLAGHIAGNFPSAPPTPRGLSTPKSSGSQPTTTPTNQVPVTPAPPSIQPKATPITPRSPRSANGKAKRQSGHP